MKRILTILTATLLANTAFAQKASVETDSPYCYIMPPPSQTDHPTPSASAGSIPVARTPEVPTLNIYHVEGGIRNERYATAIHQLTPPTIGNVGVASTFCDVVNCGDAGVLQ